MAIFETGKLRVISDKGEADLSKASISKALSVAGYDNDGKFFYVTIDKVLFSDPADTIKTVLDAHGFVANLENILACLDTFVFGVYARTSARGNPDASTGKITEYFPCIRFELPQKNKIGNILQSFYDEIARHESKATGDRNVPWLPDPAVKTVKDLRAEIDELKKNNKELQEHVSALTLQLSREQRSLSRASRALDSQRVLPDNVRICRVERVDLKRRVVKVSSHRKAFDVPTHMLDRVPESQARCLTIFAEEEDVPIGIIFLDGQEASNIERRIAELLHVEGSSFKARDSRRNEFQVKAVNGMEADTISTLSRGMNVMVSVSEGYVVRFSVLGTTPPREFTSRIHEQFIVHDIGRNQLVAVPNVEAGGESQR
ncbi:MAG: hypothetical protein ACREQZ_14050 [Woeseiaceae bacterium]